MPAALDRLQLPPRGPREACAACERHMGIILRMNNHDLRSVDFPPSRPRTIKTPVSQLLPIAVSKPVCVAKRRANIGCIIFLRSFPPFPGRSRIVQSVTGQFATALFTRESSEARIAAAPPKLPPIRKTRSGFTEKRRPNATSSNPFGNSSITSRMSSWGDLCKNFSAALPRPAISRIHHRG